LSGQEPVETSWTSGARTFRLRIRDVTADATQTSGQEPVRVGDGVGRPSLIRHVAPVYPPEARAARVRGVVMVQMTIDEAGAVSSARVLRSVPMLDAAALDAVRQWRYTPALLNGRPVPFNMTATIAFSVQ
jgi:protein TonB